MSYNYYLFVILIAISSSLGYIAILAWKRRENPVAFSFFFGMCACTLYTFGYAFEIMSTSMEQIKFWLKIEYIGIAFGTLLWFITIALFTNHKIFVRKWLFLVMMIVPVLTFISHYTNDWHHLFYQTMEIHEDAGFPLLETTPGPFYILHTVYNYLLVFLGIGMLIRMYRSVVSVQIKKQVVWLLVGSAGPYGVTLIYLSGIFSPKIDIAPIGFLFSGIFYMWGIYQFNMMKLVPNALQKVFESMKEAVIVVDQDYLITSFNQAALDVFDELQGKKVIGKSAIRLFSNYPQLVGMLIEKDSVQRKIKFDDGSDARFFQVYSSVVLDKREYTIGKMLMLNDVTEATLAEQRILSHSEQLKELNAFKDKMFTVIAHDIRDPLSILISLMEILKEDLNQLDEKHDEVVHEMDKQIQNTFSLVENLLDWFRSQKGGMVINPVVWNLSRTIERSIHLQQPKIELKRIHVISTINQDTAVYADREMLELIIRNLLTNALKFTDMDGRIFINAKEEGSKVIVSIQDTGKGIHPEQAKVLLQEHTYPISSTGTAGERGVGIGLSLCRDFVKLNGGDFWFESTPSQGSTFYFSVPLANHS
ncbi:histidine kinase N-terminal 7TM domain-containing protein [Bacillus sp. PS06]|uniref:sensor histidine kinase n=1 Tax=Bacillus sp. PS06 TaxID=2764176 RepID=UPI00177F8BD4|nr:histidine kinase N-terminal 7TM domain-containing protein [Bacillus sp. PS06]MBD8070144.1 PAS domain-containing protein [Bacillus sp. PS06]